jgi:hypothetical protein
VDEEIKKMLVKLRYPRKHRTQIIMFYCYYINQEKLELAYMGQIYLIHLNCVLSGRRTVCCKTKNQRACYEFWDHDVFTIPVGRCQVGLNFDSCIWADDNGIFELKILTFVIFF